MKRTIFQILSFTVAVFFAACSSQEEKSDAYGNFEAREIMVSAQSQGELTELQVQEGQTLQAGKTVGWIDTSSLAAKREQLQARIHSLSAKLANIRAQADVQQEQIKTLKTEQSRIKRLLKEQAATPQQYDNITGQLHVAQKKLQSIRTQKQSVYSERKVLQKQIGELETQINKCRITNPIRGTVLEQYLEACEVASPGKPVYKIADLSQMTLRVYISGAQLPDVEIGQPVEVLVDKNATENQAFQGQVTWISPRAEFTPKIIQTKEERVDLVYAVKVRVDNDGTLKIGMPGEVNFKNQEDHGGGNS